MEQLFIGDRIESEKLQDICLIEVGPLNLTLTVKGGQREKLQQDDSLGSRALEGDIQKGSRSRMVSRDFGEQGILCEKEVDTQGAAISGSKPFVFLAEGKIRYPWQILDCEDEIDIAGVPTIDILKQGKPANENMGNSIVSESTNESFRLGKKRFLIHGRFKLLK